MCNISWSYTKSIPMLTHITFTHKTINVQRIKPYKCLEKRAIHLNLLWNKESPEGLPVNPVRSGASFYACSRIT